ncbi:MAG: UDP-glucose/GDP-mannose dehydrogenase family protein [Candidatus Syntrophosphaera sp.]|jgi:UDPglucose 6-dehydrogenase|nr:UDP-glucose/GDP-mannose dehydrogenase family protein [Candidatus Cloacimonadota bacterium]MDD5624911.1 UDP-glucose/GDP-mannose dehydrogenase family protein [Candidatus Cloacimonadota bacterium]MDY0111801.1 UDP-glucose/GDP-mannose dehydrogenase family protein [Candidatus Syntrophosphaera sp.]
MNIAMIGSGYVGLVSGTCFAEMGNRVICVDKDPTKIELLKNSVVPIYEPGLQELVERNSREGRLSFTTDIAEAVQASEVIFIAVGTPPDEDGSADLQYVLAVAKDIASYMQDYKIIVDKSTVPVGTADLVSRTISEILEERGVDINFDVVSNPEFLKEGAAIEDFMRPDRIIIGADNPRAAEVIRDLYLSFNRVNERIIIMSTRSAEMTKYAANAMLATKISFINELSRLCEATGADISEVRVGIGSDTRIGYKFIYPGIGYGGSCFPKDVKALIHMFQDNNLNSQLLEAVEEINKEQKLVLVDKIKKHFGDNLKGLTFAVWGLAFKPQTDDMREAPSITIINALVNAGAKIQAYDPAAMKEAEHIFGNQPNISYTQDEYQALQNADAMLLLTEWHQFRYPDFGRIKSILRQPIIFDGRNQYEPKTMKELGFTYYSIGRT